MQEDVLTLGNCFEIYVLHAINRLATLSTHEIKPLITTNYIQHGQEYVSGIHPILQFI